MSGSEAIGSLEVVERSEREMSKTGSLTDRSSADEDTRT